MAETATVLAKLSLFFSENMTNTYKYHNIDFKKRNTAIRYSPKNHHATSFVKNGQSFKNSIKIDRRIDQLNEIAIDQRGTTTKRTSSDISSDHKLSFKSKIIKIGSGSSEYGRLKKALRTDRQTENHAGFDTLSPKRTRSARYARFASN